MADWMASGRLIDAILGLTVIEGLGVFAYHRWTGRGVPPRDFALNLLSGMALLLALRAALASAWWGWIAACLTAALVAHVGDLARRWSR